MARVLVLDAPDCVLRGLQQFVGQGLVLPIRKNRWETGMSKDRTVKSRTPYHVLLFGEDVVHLEDT